MFVQVIEGRVRDAEGLRRQMDEWLQHLAPDAIGWVGSTGGITPDGRFIMAARFESADAAARNADRPEQDEWWSVTEKTLEDVRFDESSDYQAMGECSDDAGFVQIMRCQVTDRARIEALEGVMDEPLQQTRPDILGGYMLWLSDDELLNVTYFSSEAEAREGERKELPDDLAEKFDEWQSLMGEIRWYDLPDPWLDSAS